MLALYTCRGPESTTLNAKCSTLNSNIPTPRWFSPLVAAAMAMTIFCSLPR